MNEWKVGAKVKFKHAPEYTGEIIGLCNEFVKIKTSSGEYLYHKNRLEILPEEN